MKRVNLITAAIICGLLGILLGCGGSGDLVAKVDDVKIDTERWGAYLKHSGVDEAAGAQEKQKALDSIIRRCVAASQTDKRNLINEDVLERQRSRMINQTLIQTLLQDRIDQEPELTEEEIRQYYDAGLEEAHMRHILCATEQEAQQVIKALGEGQSFKELAASHSLDEKNADKGGDLGWIPMRGLEKNIRDQIMAAEKGGILEPFPTPSGWEVVLVADRQYPSEGEYTLQRDKALSQMMQERTERIRMELSRECQDKHQLIIHQGALPLAEQPLDIMPGDEEIVVGEVGPVTISLAEIKNFVTVLSQRTGKPAHRGKAEMGSYITTLSAEKAVLATAIEDGMEDRPDVKAKIWNYEQDMKSGFFSRTYLDEAPVSEEALLSFYEQNPRFFAKPNAVTARVIESNNSENLRLAVGEIKKGMTLSAAARQYGITLVDGGKAKPVDFGNPPPELTPQAVNAMTNAPEGVWLAPFQLGKAFRAYQVATSESTGVRPFEEVGDEVRGRYLQSAGQSLLEKYLDGEGRADLEIITYPENL